jgi:hypothetical protein
MTKKSGFPTQPDTAPKQTCHLVNSQRPGAVRLEEPLKNFPVHNNRG